MTQEDAKSNNTRTAINNAQVGVTLQGFPYLNMDGFKQNLDVATHFYHIAQGQPEYWLRIGMDAHKPDLHLEMQTNIIEVAKHLCTTLMDTKKKKKSGSE